MKQSLIVLFGLALLVSPGCSDTEFTSSGGSSKVEKENNSGDASSSDNLGDDALSDTIAGEGKSLDLYLVVDVSGSLMVNDKSCLRSDAIQNFKNELKVFLGENGDVRASFILFSSAASFLATVDNFLQITDEDYDRIIKSKLCISGGKTNPGDAFELAMSDYAKLDSSSRKDLASVLFFTDGLPNIGLNSLDQRISEMKNTFKERIFSVLLWPEDGLASTMPSTNVINLPGGVVITPGATGPGATPETEVKTDDSGIPQFIRDLSVEDKRIKKVKNADGIGAAISDFIR